MARWRCSPRPATRSAGRVSLIAARPMPSTKRSSSAREASSAGSIAMMGSSPPIRSSVSWPSSPSTPRRASCTGTPRSSTRAAGSFGTTARGGRPACCPLVSPIVQPAAFFRRSAVEAGEVLLRVDLHRFLDYELWLRLHGRDVRFLHLPTALAVDRDHPQRKVRTSDDLFIRESTQLVEEYGPIFGAPRLRRVGGIDAADTWAHRRLGLGAARAGVPVARGRPAPARGATGREPRPGSAHGCAAAVRARRRANRRQLTAVPLTVSRRPRSASRPAMSACCRSRRRLR